MKPFAVLQAAGKMESSFMSEALERQDAEEVNVMKGVASTMYAGGSDTVGCSLLNFEISGCKNITLILQTTAGLGSAFLALTLYPQVFKRAQEEIDKVVGTDRLPAHTDRPDLPYIDALVKETLRWETILDISEYIR